MGNKTFSVDSYRKAKRDLGITADRGVTHRAERQASTTGHLSPLVDPAVNPVRQSKIRLDPYGDQWIVTVGCPMDIEVTCDTTGSMGGEVDTEMAVLPDLYAAVSEVLPGYDPQLCLGIFGDVVDDFVLCRPQFEMHADKIVQYLSEMAPQRAGGDTEEDPQYAMFARAYLTGAYTNRIGLKGYHFTVTDAPCHCTIKRSQIERIFGKDVLDKELANFAGHLPNMENVVQSLQRVTHQFVLALSSSAAVQYRDICGDQAVVRIEDTRQLPTVIAAIIGLTEGTLDITELADFLDKHRCVNYNLLEELSSIDIGAGARLRHALPQPLPKKGDVFAKKDDLWPVGESEIHSPRTTPDDEITYRL